MEQPRYGGATATGLEDRQPSANEYVEFVRSQRTQEDRELSGDAVLISADKKMQRIRDIISQIANANVPVLITGESGTGKEVIARMIHQASQRKGKPFVAINCAAIPANLLESELFGYEKGAFTGAMQRHMGKFEQAAEGTLLLDEVTEIEPTLQAKLLRALQEKEIERIGGNGAVPVNTRIIATTNRDIKAIVSEGSFRQDLYYRLYVIHLEVPPLRDRKDDIDALAKYYLQKYVTQFNRGVVQLTSEALEKLRAYSWPGNVRELQNVIQRAILMSKDDVITGHEIPLNQSAQVVDESWKKSLPIGRPMRDVEVQFILETLKHHQGNRTHAAKTLGISLRTLRNKINEFTAMGFQVPQPTMGKSL